MKRSVLLVDGKRVPKSTMLTAIAHDLGLPGCSVKATELARMVCEKRGWQYEGKDKVLFRRFNELLAYKGLKAEEVRRQAKTTSYASFSRTDRKAIASTTLKTKPKTDFYDSREWKEIRYLALRNNGATCQCCGATQKDSAVLHVDHVKPRSRYPHLALELSNLQILCAECNIGKGAWDETDWRPIVD